jgi:hypothetical protein
MWDVEYTDEFGTWWDTLAVEVQVSIDRDVTLLERFGPGLARPKADTIKGSRFSNMKELRVQSQGDPYRLFFAFDPRRCAILLIGGCKAGDDRFYERMIPEADRLYQEHLEQIKREGPDHGE